MTAYRCNMSSRAPAESSGLELFCAFLLGAVTYLLGQALLSYIRDGSLGTVTLYIPPFRAPTELRLSRVRCPPVAPKYLADVLTERQEFTNTCTSLLPPASADATHATNSDWVLYDLQRQRLIHDVVANEYVRPGGSYLVVSRCGAARGSLDDMVCRWVEGCHGRDCRSRSSASASLVEGWVRNAGATTDGGTLTPTSSHGTFTTAGRGRAAVALGVPAHWQDEFD